VLGSFFFFINIVLNMFILYCKTLAAVVVGYGYKVRNMEMIL